MPSAQPDPVVKPTRKTSKPKTAPKTKVADSLDMADLMTELRFLKGLVVGLQEEVLRLKEDPKQAANAETHGSAPEKEPPLFPDLPIELSLVGQTSAETQRQEEHKENPAPIFQVEPDSAPMPPPVDYDDSGGPFQPFDLNNFADDFSSALEDPIPIDWAKWIEEEPADDPASGFGEEDISESLEALAADNPSLIESVLAFNAQHPPDYIVETPFDKLAESLSVKFEDHGVKVELPASMQSQPTAHDIMAELVAEAVQGQAVAAASGRNEPEPVIALDGLFQQSLIDGPESSFGESEQSQNTPAKLDPEVLRQIPALATIRACLLPLSIDESTVTCGIPKPIDYDAIKAFEEETGLKVAMKPMGLKEVVHGLRDGYSTKDEENFRPALLSGAAPPEPITLKERVLASIPFLKAKT